MEEKTSFLGDSQPSDSLEREPSGGDALGARSRPAHGQGEAYARLTGRERWVVAELVRYKGAPNKVIAYALRISPNTLRNHLASIYAKLGVRRRVELVLYAMEQGLDGWGDRDSRRSTSDDR